MGPRDHVFDGAQIPKGEGQFLGLPGPLKIIVNDFCGINNGISATGAADCIAPDWYMSFLREKSAHPAMRPIVKIL